MEVFGRFSAWPLLNELGLLSAIKVSCGPERLSAHRGMDQLVLVKGIT